MNYKQYMNYLQYIDNMQYILNIKNMSDMQYMQDGCIGNTTHMQVLGTFLNNHQTCSQISIMFLVLVLLLVTLRTCNPSPPQTD